MWQEVFKLALNNGIWTALFLALLVYQLKDSRARETKYQKTISELNSNLNVVNNVKGQVEEVKKDVKEISSEVKITKKRVLQIKKDVDSINLKLVPLVEFKKVGAENEI